MQNLPVLEGGEPVRSKLLPYSQQWLEDDDIKAVVEILRGDLITTGPKVKEFEEKFANYVGCKYAVAVANGTAALHAAVFAAGIGPGDEVITTPITFAASANCVLYQGGKVVFADIKNQDWNIDPEEVLKNITPHTKAIIPVHFTGLPVDLEPIRQIAKKYNLVVIEDAAHALGATYRGGRIGAQGDLTIFSFHPVKHITTGEGGMITTNDENLYQKLLAFRTHGITRNKKELLQNDGLWYYEMQALGFNYRLTDFQAALGLSQLNKSDRFLHLRKEIAGNYDKMFSKLEELELSFRHPDRESAWHLYIIRLNENRLRVGRRQIFDALRAENIGVNVHYLPVYLHPYYRALGYEAGLCPNAESLYSNMITLPLFPKMTPEDVVDVVTAVKKVISYYKKDGL